MVGAIGRFPELTDRHHGRRPDWVHPVWSSLLLAETDRWRMPLKCLGPVVLDSWRPECGSAFLTAQSV